MDPPFTLPPHSTQSFLFFVDHAASAAAPRAALQSCALLSDYVIPRADLQQLALVALDPGGRIVPEPAPTPRGAAQAAAAGTLPEVLVDMVLHAPHAVGSPLEQKAAAHVAAAVAAGAEVSLRGSLEAGTAVAAVCTSAHNFRLELPSFSPGGPPGGVRPSPLPHAMRLLLQRPRTVCAGCCMLWGQCQARPALMHVRTWSLRRACALGLGVGCLRRRRL